MQIDWLMKLVCLLGGFFLLKNKKYEIIYDDKSKNETILSFKDSNMIVLTNHMTLIDSSVLHNYFANIFNYFYFIKNNFRPFVWNLPAKENLQILKNTYKNPLYRFFFRRLGRLLPIDRSDPDSSKKTLEKVVDMTVNNHHVFNIFPEAGRTRRDEFCKDDVTPGAAKVIVDIKKKTGKYPTVLCVYLRSENQVGYSDVPAPGKINVVARILNIKIKENISDLRTRKEISNLIGNQLEENQNIWKSEI